MDLRGFPSPAISDSRKKPEPGANPSDPIRSDPAVRGREIRDFKERLDSGPPQSVGSSSIRMSPSGSMKMGFQVLLFSCMSEL
ncbi:hypothetical protein AMECASPLE_011879 [Ameca splendens]|uniref:Uncharacterized protein n=1 Tax=Ameca splendens TaxID=208324 RepID=A0ABV0YYT9_9TELE